MIELKTDNRYKDANIKLVKGKLRGNARTMEHKHLVIPLAKTYDNYFELLALQLNPPIVVGKELGSKIKEHIDD